MQVVSATSRQLLVLEPFSVTDALLSALQSAGWILQRCTPGMLASQSGDAIVMYLDRQPSQVLLRQLQQTGLACVVLADAQWLHQADKARLGACFFRILPASIDSSPLLDALQQAQAAKPWYPDSNLQQPGHGDAPVTLEDYILRAERQALSDVLGRYRNMSQAARTLGVSRPTLYRLLHKHGLR